MISLMKILEYVDLRESGISTRKAAKFCSISRTTGEKYYKKYKENRATLFADPTNDNSQKFIEECLTSPPYDASTRSSRKYTPEVNALLDQILEHEQEYLHQLGSSRKQLSCTQILTIIQAAEFDVGLSTITKKVKEKRKRN